MIQTKIGEFTIKFKNAKSKNGNNLREKVVIQSQNLKTKEISIDKFLKKGMMLFPKRLYNRIKNNVKAAKQYDDFVDKIYEQCSNK